MCFVVDFKHERCHDSCFGLELRKVTKLPRTCCWPGDEELTTGFRKMLMTYERLFVEDKRHVNFWHNFLNTRDRQNPKCYIFQNLKTDLYEKEYDVVPDVVCRNKCYGADEVAGNS